MRIDDWPVLLAQQDDEPIGPSGPGVGETEQQGEAQEGANGSGEQGAGGGQNQAPPPGDGFFGTPLLLLLGVLVIMWIFLGSSQRRERKKKQQMLAQLSKGAKVQTIGGIIGTVVEVRDEEVVLKVDENANTRLRFSRNSIQSVLDQKEQQEDSK